MLQRFSRLTTLLLCLISLLGLSSTLFLYSSRAQSTSTYTVYLPWVTTSNAKPGVFGMQISQLIPERDLQGLVALEPSWVRRGALLWKDIEPVEGGGYHWDSPQIHALEAEMIAASQHNLNLILIVHTSPRWATAPYASDCAPINPAKYAAFAHFMAEAVKRYSVAPYNVRYWEIGNEPDAYIFPTDSVFGCWGVKDDPYYGGREYGEMLKVIYPAIKGANAQVSVLNGGLLLDKAYNPTSKNPDLSGRFIEGVFVTGAADSFDILSYHAYSYYNGTVDGSAGSVDWKVPYLRNIMRTYGVKKPLFNTEGALLCPIPSSECLQAQADVMARIYARTFKNNLMGFIWYVYDNDSFHNTALIEPNNMSMPRPAYNAYQHASAMFYGVTYQDPLPNLPASVEGYRFRRGSATLMVFWSDTPVDVTLPLPEKHGAQCTNWDGAVETCPVTNGQVTLRATKSPIFVLSVP